MNLAAKSFSVFTTDTQRYVRDLAYRLLRDEAMTEARKGESEFVVVVYTKEEFAELKK